MNILNAKYIDDKKDGVLLTFEDTSTFQIPTQKERYQYTDLFNEFIKDGGVIEDFKTLNEKVKESRENKTNEINKDCKKAIISGFKSSAKEIEYKYESDEVDQLNLIGAATTGVRQNIKCSSDNGATWQWIDHLSSEIKQVLKDGAISKATYLKKAALLKEQISTASLEQLDQIKW